MRYLLVLLLAGCATTQPPSGPVLYWDLAKCAGSYGAPGYTSNFRLNDAKGATVATADTSHCAAAWRATSAIERVSGQSVEIVLLTNRPAINAGAFYKSAENHTHPAAYITVRMLQMIGNDEAAWAALMGHELAHLAKRHGDTRQAANAAAQVVGNALALVIPGLGGWAAGTVAMNAGYGAYTRPQEAEADAVGLGWMLEAGYDKEGMKRLFDKMMAATGSSGAMPEFLSTHPSSEHRYEEALKRQH